MAFGTHDPCEGLGNHLCLSGWKPVPQAVMLPQASAEIWRPHSSWPPDGQQTLTRHPHHQCWVLHCHHLLDTDPKLSSSQLHGAPQPPALCRGTQVPFTSLHHHLLFLRCRWHSQLKASLEEHLLENMGWGDSEVAVELCGNPRRDQEKQRKASRPPFS